MTREAVHAIAPVVRDAVATLLGPGPEPRLSAPVVVSDDACLGGRPSFYLNFNTGRRATFDNQLDEARICSAIAHALPSTIRLDNIQWHNDSLCVAVKEPHDSDFHDNYKLWHLRTCDNPTWHRTDNCHRGSHDSAPVSNNALDQALTLLDDATRALRMYAWDSHLVADLRAFLAEHPAPSPRPTVLGVGIATGTQIQRSGHVTSIGDAVEAVARLRLRDHLTPEHTTVKVERLDVMPLTFAVTLKAEFDPPRVIATGLRAGAPRFDPKRTVIAFVTLQEAKTYLEARHD